MELENSVDFGGEEISKFDILTDNIFCKIKSLNPVIGTPDDPMYDKYKAHRAEFANAELILIDANALNRNSVSSLDLSGNYTSNDLASNFFQLIAGTLIKAFGKDEYGVSSKKNEYDGFGDFTEFGETEFSSLSDGKY